MTHLPQSPHLSVAAHRGRRTALVVAAGAMTVAILTGCTAQTPESNSAQSAPTTSTVRDTSAPYPKTTAPVTPTTKAVDSSPTNRYGSGGPVPDQAQLKGPYVLDRVLDGDTIKIGMGVTVRVIGADAAAIMDPKTKKAEPCGPEASAALTDMLASGKVWTEYDHTQDRTDRYGRNVAHVRTAHPVTGQPDKLVSYELISAGLGKTYLYAGRTHRYTDILDQAQTSALENNQCIWQHG
ncbi:endonuclease YncB(thermonuclease family) [Rhodococcus sp. 27YEA15]|uniref:thermonuclease family protein n=1 Tax=Rhodococcus sp. 27YEA15 TaxID=3156259 RepID=UPI003C7AD8F2